MKINGILMKNFIVYDIFVTKKNNGNYVRNCLLSFLFSTLSAKKVERKGITQ